MTKQVTLTIDGQTVSVPAGTLIVDAAKKIGIDIPVFCYHPKMEPVGMCRMCLVDIGRPVIDRATGQPVLEADGAPKIQFGPKLDTACTVPVSEGMVVVGMSDKVQTARNDILELLLTSHPLDCPICDKGGECPLQNLTMRHGPGESRFLYDEKLHAAKNLPLGDLIFLDRERCIQCARCIRFQDEIVDDPVLQFYQRGRATDIITNSEPGFDSYWSGNTTDICPVGALTTADFRFGARPWELKFAASLCTHCPVGCNLTYNTRREAKSGGRVVIKRAMPRQNEWVNELWICDKGRFVYHFTEAENRLSEPLACARGDQTPMPWEDILGFVADRLTNIGAGLLTLVSGRLPNEDLYNLKKLTEALGGQTALYTHMAGGDLVARYGLGEGSNLADLGKGDAIVVIASDLEEEAPLWWLRVKQAAERGATLIVANPRPTKLSRYANLEVSYVYGEEVAAVAQISNLSYFAEAQNAVIFFGSEGLGLDGSAALAQACADLLAQSGHTGKPNNGLVGVWPRANEQGAWDVGFRPLANLADEMAQAKVLYIIGADPAADDPNLAALLKRRYEMADRLTIVQDVLKTETAKLADVILPAQAQTEREGTFTSGERRVQRFYPATTPKGQALPDFEIAARIGTRLGIEIKGRFPSLVFPQIAKETPGYAGLSYQKLAQSPEQWPIVGRTGLYYGGTGYKNEQGVGVQLQQTSLPAFQPSSGKSEKLKDKRLIAVPVTSLYDHGTMVMPSAVLHPRIPQPFLVMHPRDAEAQKAAEGMTVNVSVNGASVKMMVRINEAIPAGFVLVPRSMGLALDGPAAVEIKIAEAITG
jgi:NADH-quinone oxidoreductase subunit G